MECILHSSQEIFNDKGEHTVTQVIGRIVMFHAIEALATKTPSGNYAINYEGYSPIGRMGGNDFVHLSEISNIFHAKISGINLKIK